MRRFFTLLSLTVAIIFLSGCVQTNNTEGGNDEESPSVIDDQITQNNQDDTQGDEEGNGGTEESVDEAVQNLMNLINEEIEQAE